ncbi:MAG: hypothetical protein E7032_03370 [Akkermansiaceae bacterium]|nr:hypothetical protein [Akkermansiaceae bacterium]
MKKAFYIALVAAGLLAPLPLEAAQQYDTQEKAAENATDDGYILFVYGKGWDRYSEDLCKKVIAAPEISEAAGNAALILTPFYQYATPEDKEAQRAVWGALAEPAAHSMETYPSLLMYDKEGFLYGRVQGPVLLRGTMAEIAAEVKAKLEAKHKQEEIMKRAEAASGVEAAKLIAEAWAVPGIEPPKNYRNLVKAADPNDESGMVRRLHFDGWGLAQKYCGKKSDGGLELGDEATIAKMKEFMKDPAYTPEQRQTFYAIIIGVLNRGGGNAMQIKGYANEMKRLNPESNLGISADQVIKIWGGGNGKK